MPDEKSKSPYSEGRFGSQACVERITPPGGEKARFGRHAARKFRGYGRTGAEREKMQVAERPVRIEARCRSFGSPAVRSTPKSVVRPGEGIRGERAAPVLAATKMEAAENPVGRRPVSS